MKRVGRLTASEERYHTLVAILPDGIGVVDRTGKILDCNEQFVRLHGYESHSDVIGRFAAEFVQAEDYECLYQTAEAAFRRGERLLRGVRVDVLRRDGSVCPAEYSIAAAPRPEAPSGVVYIAAIRDITQQIESLAALEGRRASLEAAVQQRTRDLEAEIARRARFEDAFRQRVRELSSLEGLAQTISFASPLDEIASVYLERLIGVASADIGELFLLRGQELRLVATSAGPTALALDGEKATLEESLSKLALQTGGPVFPTETPSDPAMDQGCGPMHSIVALPLRSADATIGVLLLGALLPDAFDGQLPFLETAAGIVAARLHNARLHQEVQERVAGLEEAVAERTRELQTERDRTQAVLDTVGESVVVADADGAVLFANPATMALTGSPRDEIVGQPLWSQWSEQTLAKVWPEVQRAVGSGRAWHGEITGRRAEGAIYTAGLTATPLCDLSTGEPIGSVWVQRDITLVKEAERLKDQFVSNVSHELRTPISILALTSDNLEAYWDRLDEGERRRMVQDIHEQAHLLSRLAEDILRMAQIDSGRTASARSPVDISRLVQQEVAEQQLVARQRYHTLTAITETSVFVIGNESIFPISWGERAA